MPLGHNQLLHQVADPLVRAVGETGYVSFVFHQRTSNATAERAAKEQLSEGQGGAPPSVRGEDTNTSEADGQSGPAGGRSHLTASY